MSKLLSERLMKLSEGKMKKDDKRKVTKWPIKSTATWSLGFLVHMGVMAVKHPKNARLGSVHGLDHPGDTAV